MINSKAIYKKKINDKARQKYHVRGAQLTGETSRLCGSLIRRLSTHESYNSSMRPSASAACLQQLGQSLSLSV